MMEQSRAGARAVESQAACQPALPELWGGVECTVNRVGDEYFDQFEASGHDSRIEDLETFARLGIKAMRYPVLWERTLPKDSIDIEKADWTWADARLAKLRELNIRPIVGLVHHGSGPRPTSLVDEAFPEHLARYAAAVARRYPWVDSYTPINEPLTTARFSGLYGHWYPHAHDALTFARALLIQCRATVLAIRAIREINPHAQLIQTEDLGKTWSTPVLSYQAAFENERRWVTFDLLCGELDRHRPVWDYLRWLGIPERDLAWFVENPSPPDIIGLNYYLTSERFLDNRTENHPEHARGGNHRHAYADTEAVRVRAGGLAGARSLLAEAWERFRRPLAITEVHNGCTREEQMRWFVEVWRGAQSLRAEAVDVRAVTAWSLLGAYDWNSLLTRREGHYEPGVFDLRAPAPRPTALATVISEIASGAEPSHPVLAAPGWWRRPSRFIFGFAVSNGGRRQPIPHLQTVMNQAHEQNPRPLLITGATGTLGRAFARLCHMRGIVHHLLTRDEMDIADESAIAEMIDKTNAWAIINTAGYVRVDDAENEPERCRRENTEGARSLACICHERGVKLLTFSSDLVFDGAKNEPYVESDRVAPLNVYGASKAEAEACVLELAPSSLVIRTSAFFGLWDEHNFVIHALRTLAANREFIAADDARISPTYVPDLVQASLDLLIDDERGIWHLANPGGDVTWTEFARLAARHANLDPQLVRGQATAELNLAAPRPLYSVLGSERATNIMPSLEYALARFVRESEVRWTNDVIGGVEDAAPSHEETPETERKAKAATATAA